MIECGDVVCLNDVSAVPADLFYIDDNGALICRNKDSFRFDGANEIIAAFNLAVSKRDYSHSGGKPAPTSSRKLRSGSPSPVSYGTLSSKNVGRLLAAGGIYNDNVEGFHQTAEQLGGDAPAGYNQVMDNKGLLVAGASVAIGFGLGRLSSVGEPEQLSALSKVSKPLPSEQVVFKTRQLQKKFKHAVDFNLSGNSNDEGLELFEEALKNHVDDPLTQKIIGKYRWNQEVYHYYNSASKLNVMTKMDGDFISGWKLSETQASDLTGEGNVF